MKPVSSLDRKIIANSDKTGPLPDGRYVLQGGLSSAAQSRRPKVDAEQEDVPCQRYGNRLLLAADMLRQCAITTWPIRRKIPENRDALRDGVLGPEEECRAKDEWRAKRTTVRSTLPRRSSRAKDALKKLRIAYSNLGEALVAEIEKDSKKITDKGLSKPREEPCWSSSATNEQAKLKQENAGLKENAHSSSQENKKHSLREERRHSVRDENRDGIKTRSPRRLWRRIEKSTIAEMTEENKGVVRRFFSRPETQENDLAAYMYKKPRTTMTTTTTTMEDYKIDMTSKEEKGSSAQIAWISFARLISSVRSVCKTATLLVDDGGTMTRESTGQWRGGHLIPRYRRRAASDVRPRNRESTAQSWRMPVS